ncbi:aspartyl-phosphate phosphatase Spo0E family protein [Filobacillus milosensis]|uniref:Aspartyl-phosphate phosphatase Spo0E family protein n=1 Tax=Filobacillus milosensis TaxID=94137 RepID=A0A4Y8IFH4_9BACI|nr:aspartyl-phosphate phosphatase Spo0E family protein [Filobacillus milosensis]TFB13684.1 aspartyl-phosphate phosphatase Spo0E family protein [Filobacillus milosensis]
MTLSKYALSISIQKVRNHLYKLSETKNLTDIEVVECSQKLGRLLNKYQGL